MGRCRNRRADWWQGRFSGFGYRVTVPRRAIINVLNGAQKLLSAEDIYILVRKVYPNIGFTTVYRTLDLLGQAGLVAKFDFGDGRARYELSPGPGGKKHHHHLVCIDCGRVIDYDGFEQEEKEFLDKVETALSKKFNFKITRHLIQFYGLCGNCRRQASE